MDIKNEMEEIAKHLQGKDSNGKQSEIEALFSVVISHWMDTVAPLYFFFHEIFNGKIKDDEVSELHLKFSDHHVPQIIELLTSLMPEEVRPIRISYSRNVVNKDVH
jgi:hypothetical protein